MSWRLLPYGPDAVLVELGSAAGVVAVASAVRASGPAWVIDVVPAARTVLVRAARGALVEAEIAALVAVAAEQRAAPPMGRGETVELPVSYDGEDLDHVASLVGCDAREVVAMHSGAEYVVAFCGFSPGFAYLSGLVPALHLPRRAEPRARVPAGSVAIAAEYTAVYPTSSPGGWHLLGRTTADLWQPSRRPPALLVPGTVVHFIQTRFAKGPL